MKAREGDLLETPDGIVFDVKGLIHPPDRIIAFPRFIPDPHGNRKRGDRIYRKVYALSERYELLKERFPQYLVSDLIFGERLSEIPKEDIRCYYNPVDRLREFHDCSELDELEADALCFAELLQNHSDIRRNKLGISGSLLVQLHTLKSDIDPIVYGKRSCFKVYEALQSMMKEKKSLVKAYTQEELRNLYGFRSKDTEMPFDDFITIECRKVLQGKFLQHDFYIRCVKDWNEIEERYGDVVYKRVGYAKIKATISDDSEAIFTPCRYSVDHVQLLKGTCKEVVSEIASFRGRFCEQAGEGEIVIAQGKVERVQKKDSDTFFRLLLGGKPSDFMVLER